ncbi:hypothetical protein RCL1_005157 [Eukaryota sp. TZLM3-RCL]
MPRSVEPPIKKSRRILQHSLHFRTIRKNRMTEVPHISACDCTPNRFFFLEEAFSYFIATFECGISILLVPHSYSTKHSFERLYGRVDECLDDPHFQKKCAVLMAAWCMRQKYDTEDQIPESFEIIIDFDEDYLFGDAKFMDELMEISKQMNNVYFDIHSQTPNKNTCRAVLIRICSYSE